MDCAFTRGVAALARYVFDEDINVHTIAAIKDIYSGEEIFCDYGDKYQLHGGLAGMHNNIFHFLNISQVLGSFFSCCLQIFNFCLQMFQDRL